MTQQSEARIWLNGEIVDAEGARLSHLTHTFHYGLGAFEGIRSYEIAPGTGAVFRLEEHIRRLVTSCRIVTIAEDLPFTVKDLCDACIEVLRLNGLAEGYLRPVVYLGSGSMGVGARDNPVHAMVSAWKWGAYLGAEGLERGIRACVSSYNRPSLASAMSKAKLTGGYVNGILAKREALAHGYDEAILLNDQGYVTEASGENLFMVIDGVLVTPPLGMNILAGITRATVITLAHDLGCRVDERVFGRDEMYGADEIFMTGTAAEVTPVREVDGRRIGEGRRGPMTTELQALYFDVIRGKRDAYRHWLTTFEL